MSILQDFQVHLVKEDEVESEMLCSVCGLFSATSPKICIMVVCVCGGNSVEPLSGVEPVVFRMTVLCVEGVNVEF